MGLVDSVPGDYKSHKAEGANTFLQNKNCKCQMNTLWSVFMHISTASVSAKTFNKMTLLSTNYLFSQ